MGRDAHRKAFLFRIANESCKSEVFLSSVGMLNATIFKYMGKT